MKLMACAVVAMSMLAGAAQAGEWRLIAVNKSVAMLVDTSTVRVSPYSQKKLAWVVELYPETNKYGEDYALINYEYDCSSLISTVVSMVTYGVDSSPVMTFPDRKPPAAVVPDSFGHKALKAVCDGSSVPPVGYIWQALEVYRTMEW